MKPAVLLYVPWTFDMLGGVDVVVDRLRAGLERDGRFRPLIGVHDWEGTHPNHVNAGGRTFLPLALPHWSPSDDSRSGLWMRASILRRALAVAAALRRNGVVVFNAHFPSLQLYAVALAKRLGLWRGKLVLSFHGSDVAAVEPHRREWQFIASQSEAVTACSRALAKDVEALGLFPTLTVGIAYNGIDADRFADEANDASWNPVWGSQYLLGVGTFTPVKSQDELIAAFARLADDFPDLNLVLAGGRGNGVWLANVEAMARSTGLGHRVHFLVDVPHDRMASLMANARILLHASRREGFSLVLLEAGALGVPIVATNVGGIPEVVGKDAAILYEPGDLARLVVATRELLVNPARAVSLAQRMRERIAQRFSVDAMTVAYLAHYRG
jgi:glycosyltransferase involved in cell wall biosynthesis